MLTILTFLLTSYVLNSDSPVVKPYSIQSLSSVITCLSFSLSPLYEWCHSNVLKLRRNIVGVRSQIYTMFKALHKWTPVRGDLRLCLVILRRFIVNTESFFILERFFFFFSFFFKVNIVSTLLDLPSLLTYKTRLLHFTHKRICENITFCSSWLGVSSLRPN